MCYLPKGGDEERITPSVPHITNVQDTQRDPHPNTTRYVGPGTHTRIALTPPLFTGGAYESATPVCSGFLGGDLCMVVYSVWYVIIVHLSGAEEEVSVGNLRSSVSREGLYIVAVPRSQNPPPPHKRTHAERARAPPPPHTAPARAPNRRRPPRQAPSSTHLLRATTNQSRTNHGAIQSPTQSHHRSFPPACQTSRPYIKLGCINFAVMLYLLL
ncbi:hypothetical protein DPMN_144364 [Dreissena polymorpha]|uniref:Uncharacterized protein n=1 Tax=Dreissena polymorpha TaxID=45954 RepID=A0A9D4GHZ6_DREPO|nr:hypothetical protein DPMN_144364 [Dreissena polymorpha]